MVASAGGSLRRRRSSLFLVGGVLVAGFAAGFVIEALTTVTVPESVFAGAGFTFGFLGLLGMYPSVVSGNARLARAGAAFAALGAVGFAVTFVVGVAEALQVAVPGWVAPLVVLNVLGIIFGYLSFGVATLRTDDQSRRLGLLLLVPAMVFVVNFVRVMLRGGPGSEALLPEVSAVLASGQALALLGIGYTIRREEGRTDRTQSPADSPARRAADR